jgi:16S rRNA processing protein RimM
MGRVLGPFGVKGELRLFYYGQDMAMLASLEQIWLGPEPGEVHSFTPQAVRRCQGRLLLQTKEIIDRDQAAAHSGQWLFIARGALPPLGDDEFYWCDLIGAQVEDVSGTPLGRVINIHSGPQELLEIKSPLHVASALIPMVKPIVQEMDLENKKVVVELPHGLLETQWG